MFLYNAQIYLVGAPGHIISTVEENSLWQFWVMVFHILVSAN